jgi:hypothetical protein
VLDEYEGFEHFYERRTLRNFFRRNYPYARIGGRIAFDVAK